jgi:uncharacterized membrane protein YfcA
MIAALLLALAGVGAGLTASVASLASLVSYPALLAFGLSPVAANVTNTVALSGNLLGTWASARAELRGSGRRVLYLSAVAAIGGAVGAGLLLVLPAGVFGAIVPLLIASGSVLLLLRDKIRAMAVRHGPRKWSQRPWLWCAGIFGVAVYGGYFGAAAGILMLALLAHRYAESFAVTKAVSTIIGSAANLVAAVVFAVSGPVHWWAALWLGLGLVIGSWVGFRLVRVMPEKPLRVFVGFAGLGLALYLFLT